MHLTGVSPVLLVADLDRSVAYYSERLGFECEVYGDPPNFAAANRNEVTILLALSPESARLVPNWQIVENMWNVYIRVDDADAAYAEVQNEALRSTTRSTTRRTGSASSASRIRTGTTSRSGSR
jgi:catechol 2,3-dioxygenase-like lactoylglutathione lyase family enzyme